MTVSVSECLEKGAIGSLGAIPGTLCAHPLDLIKIRLQTGSISIQDAISQTRIRGFYAGIVPGILQKVLTRGPMFFTSELCTQACEHHVGLKRERAVVVGSFASGYITGTIASLSEWSKVQTGTRSAENRTGTVHLVRTRFQHGHITSVFRVMRGAGLRNAVFDSTFFGVEHWLRSELDFQRAISFSIAAGVALFVDYPIDVLVKRNMALHGPVNQGLLPALWQVLRDGQGKFLYKGAQVKCLEFATSYFITGAFAPIVLRASALALLWTPKTEDTFWREPPDP